MKTIDMSEQAVLRRLKQVDQLRELCISLMRAKPISEEKAAKMREKLRSEGSELTKIRGDMNEPLG